GYLYHFHRQRLVEFVAGHRTAILAASILLLLPVTVLSLERDRAMVTAGLTGLYLGFGGLLLCAVIDRGEPSHLLGLGLAAAAATGAYSYSIYLWHIPAVGFSSRLSQLLFGESGGPSWVRILLYVMVSIVVGVVMARLIEFPVLRLRDQML